MASHMTFRGRDTALNITAPTLLFTGGGRIARVSVLVAGSAGTVNDAVNTGAAVAANAVAPIPAAVGVYEIDMKVYSGLVIKPGSGQTVAVSYTGVNPIAASATTEPE